MFRGANRDYVKNALSGKSNVSDPLVSKIDGSVIVVYAVPIKYNRVLLEVTDGNKLSELTNQVKVGETDYAFMLRKDGETLLVMIRTRSSICIIQLKK